MENSDSHKKKLISIVTPVFNEEKGINLFYATLMASVQPLEYNFEVIFVNDGSLDNSLEVMTALHQKDPRVKIVSLSRNFGHQNALTSGIDHAKGDAIILMDVDLEDNPEYIPEFLKEWEKGNLVVFAKRGERNAAWYRKICFALFHKINHWIGDLKFEAMGIFCLMDRKVSGYLTHFTEKDRYIPGLRKWIGFKQVGIETNRGSRYDNRPRVKIRQLFKLAFDSFVSFSTFPLKISIFIGLIFSFLSFTGIIIIVCAKLFFGLAVQGWASTICLILLIGGIQLICFWLQGEYISRIFNEVKNRPNYIIDQTIGI